MIDERKKSGRLGRILRRVGITILFVWCAVITAYLLGTMQLAVENSNAITHNADVVDEWNIDMHLKYMQLYMGDVVLIEKLDECGCWEDPAPSHQRARLNYSYVNETTKNSH